MFGHVEQRRVFRGRGGPNDRRLPKHNARRRRYPKLVPNERVHDPSTTSIEDNRNNVQKNEEDDQWSTEEEEIDEEVNVNEPKTQVKKDVIYQDESLQSSSPNIQFLEEVNHLKQRIKNVKYSIQTSTVALNNPTTYQNNVLRAILNCITEWKSTLKYHRGMIEETLECEEIQIITICKTCGLSLFELVQQGLQCGPLAGSKPGYFRRCGSETAQMVLDFLMELAATKEDLLALFWSEKQADAVEKWKNEASKAVRKDADPSKHVKKKMHEAVKKKGKK